MKIHILVPAITNRLKYITSFIFSDILQLDVELHVDFKQFTALKGFKFNYTDKTTGNVPSVIPASLLFDSGVQPEIYLSCKEKGIEKAFATQTTLDSLNFDLFAAAFFLLSRYEEYVNPNRDEHNRFCAVDSLSFLQGFLENPVVDQWAYQLKSELQRWYPEVRFPERTFNAISTIDVDNNYAYRHKSFIRHSGSSIKSLLKGDFEDLKTRLHVLSGKRKDPFDTYDYLFQLHKKYNLELLFFILTANYGRYDKNHPVNSKAFQQLVKKLSAKAGIGIHPSYGSHGNKQGTIQEKQTLEKITNKQIIKSRQHFLKMSLPITYRNLLAIGIHNDFTMGYHDHAGFRSGTCTPFLFFDLGKNEATRLMVYPFAVMDITLRQYMELSPEQALRITGKFMDKVKNVQGTWINLWHNESVSDYREWSGWKKVFELSLNHMSVEK